MARLRDVPRVLVSVGPFEFARRVWNEICDDSVFVWSAALAYAWLFAIFPFFIFLLTLLPYLPAHVKDEAEAPMHRAIFLLPPETAQLVWQNVENVMHRPHRGLLSTGILVTIWAASGGMNMTMAALDRCYDVANPRPFYRQRPLAVLMTIVVATLILAVLILLPIGTVVTHFIRDHEIALISRGMLIALNVARYSLALVLMMAVLAIMYQFGPQVRQRMHAVTPGAAFTITVWMLLGFAFRLYVTKFGKYDQTYGTVGGVVILLLFFYIDAVVLLVGAEINSEIDFALGVPRGSLDFRTPLSAREPEDVIADEASRAADAKASP